MHAMGALFQNAVFDTKEGSDSPSEPVIVAPRGHWLALRWTAATLNQDTDTQLGHALHAPRYNRCEPYTQFIEFAIAIQQLP
jgi:hypothetical protein